ncbi:MAG: mannitol dehydrogenase family protein [Ktedonobacterales bacterium]
MRVGTVLEVAANPGVRPVTVPSYQREGLTPGIIHFGVGGFHRAHQAMYIDRLLSAGNGDGWAICGAGVTTADQRMRDVLGDQQGMYTLVLRHSDGREEARIIGSIVDFLYAPDDPERLLEKLAAPATRIVSLTITEGGYNFHAVTGEFDASNPAVRADLEPGATPATVFGVVAEALRRRRDRGMAPFTIMSCDNIPSNGHAARRSFTSFARLLDPELADWIDDTVRFPNSMVDRITPATTSEDTQAIRRNFGIRDEWPVVCEPFEQWVLEDDFANGRPAYETVGVQLVADARPYELMKLRLLNGSHQALAYFAALAGCHYVHEASQDPNFAAFLLRYMVEEATPTLRPVPGIDLSKYCATLIERFSNAYVRDTVARLAAETSDRLPKFILPVVTDQLKAGRSVDLCAAVVASWARYAEGRADDGMSIEVIDRLHDQVVRAAANQGSDPLSFLRMRDLFGDLVDQSAFTVPYLAALQALRDHGARAVVASLARHQPAAVCRTGSTRSDASSVESRLYL